MELATASMTALDRVAKAGIAKVRIRCNNCGADDANVIARGRDHEYDNTTPDLFDVVRCRCGLVYLNPRPATSELSTIYPPNYYSYNVTKLRTASSHAGDSFLARLFRARNINRFRRYVQMLAQLPRSEQRILDLGCGDGTTLGYWRDVYAALVNGRTLQTHGIEMNPEAAEVARAAGHHVTGQRVEDTELQDKFDLIYSFHVIEHVDDPTGFLSKAREALQPDGYVLIDTPNIDSFDYRLFGSHWGGYHFPRHFNLYDAKTFGALAEKTGLRVQDIFYYPIPVFWIWGMHSLLQPRMPKLADAMFPPVEIVTRGSLWNVGLMSAFAALDYGLKALTGRCSAMRVLLTRA